MKIGDTVTRLIKLDENLIGGEIPMKLKISNITETEIHCGPWRFDKFTLFEIDEDLDWDGKTASGSRIKIHEN